MLLGLLVVAVLVWWFFIRQKGPIAQNADGGVSATVVATKESVERPILRHSPLRTIGRRMLGRGGPRPCWRGLA